MKQELISTYGSFCCIETWVIFISNASFCKTMFKKQTATKLRLTIISNLLLKSSLNLDKVRKHQNRCLFFEINERRILLRGSEKNSRFYFSLRHPSYRQSMFSNEALFVIVTPLSVSNSKDKSVVRGIVSKTRKWIIDLRNAWCVVNILNKSDCKTYCLKKLHLNVFFVEIPRDKHCHLISYDRNSPWVEFLSCCD